MKGGIRIGAIFGIPLFVHPSWFIIAALASWVYSSIYSQILPAAAWTLGILTALLLFASVFLHELGHSLTAKAQGIEVDSITLFLFGGVASLKSESKDPWSAFTVAIAGPLVSLLLSILLFGITWFAAGDGFLKPNTTPANLVAELGVAKVLLAVMSFTLAQLNLVLFLFNMLPGLPLDGGQILKAIVWKISGSQFTGIIWAARSGQILGYLAIFFGISLMVSKNGFSFNGLWLVLLGWLGLSNSAQYLQITRIQQSLLEITAEETMTRDFRIVDADLTLRQFADDFLLMENKESQPIYFASSNGRDRGLIVPEDIRYIDRIEWSGRNLHSIVKPLQSLDALELKAKLPQVIQLLESKQIKFVTVFSPTGSVAGVIDRGDVIRALCRKLKAPISESFIKKVKSEGKFPPELPLAQLCAQLPANQQGQA